MAWHAARQVPPNLDQPRQGGMAMDWDDLRAPKPGSVIEIGEPLDALSLAELETRIQALKIEIARVEAELARKRAHEAAASALFKS